MITKDPAYEEPYLSDAEVEMLEALEDERLLQEVNALLDAEANTPEDNLTPTP